MPYKISGNMSENCNIKIFQGNDYIGYREATGSSHNTVFDLTSSGVVTTVAESSSGEIVGYGSALPTSTGDSVNITSPAGGASINNIQQATITMAGASGSDTATISAVVMANTVLLYDGISTGNDVGGGSIKTVLTNTTTITADRIGDGSGAVDVKVTALEFTNGSITGVQRGIIFLNTWVASNTATITAVDTSKAVLLHLGTTTTGSTNESRVNIQLTNATTVTATRGSDQAPSYVSYEVLEFS